MTVTWHLDNPDGEQQAFHTEQIGDGQEASWTQPVQHCGRRLGAQLSIDSGNDSLNLHHVVVSFEVRQIATTRLKRRPQNRTELHFQFGEIKTKSEPKR